MRKTVKRRRQSESGYALLFVMVMAAVIAVMLYQEMPRVVFEGQRAKEDLLVQRGEQYYRAIQLFVRRTRTYPPSIAALENTNNIRFLRRRYKDPMTGKDDWRLIHAGPGGIFTDSLTRKAPLVKDKDGKDIKDPKDATAAAQVDPNDPNAQAAAYLKLRHGASDASPYRAAGPGSNDAAPPAEESYVQPAPPGAEYQDPNQQAVMQPQQGAQQPGRTNYPYTPQPGQPYPMTGPPQPGQPYPVAGRPQPGQPYPVPGQPQAPQGDPSEQNPVQSFDESAVNPAEAGQEIQPGSAQINPQPVQPQPPYQPMVPAAGQPPVQQPGGMGMSGGMAGGYQPGFRNPGGAPPGAGPSSGGTAGTFTPGVPGPGSNAALLAIQQQLSGARAGAVPGSGQMLGAGIAGVASKSEQEGIRVYKEKSKYKEWEFLYDQRTDMSSAVSRGAPVQPGMQSGGGTGAGSLTK